ncbi:hypothetical protein MKX07_003641 [Trichoderma sp. CBMAI-0711]|uniref:Uncharacterized protein n=1 Tax=Trichoderma parareesei TaxID=858221 RepID=A0A2H2ZNT6_TRIPA|nr:hypothetical protein MKX07_003641 [Trichoderma sp. CBMAI-0711]OTA01711.1 hypothetical protein A9Z42_0020550 [Trichoderma parareesei]
MVGDQGGTVQQLRDHGPGSRLEAPRPQGSGVAFSRFLPVPLLSGARSQWVAVHYYHDWQTGEGHVLSDLSPSLPSADLEIRGAKETKGTNATLFQGTARPAP